jgi:hypothetical protein
MRGYLFKTFLAVLFLGVFLCGAFSGECRAGDERLLEIEKELDGLKEENRALKKRVDEIEGSEEEIRHSFSILSKLVEVSGYADAEFSLTDEDGENSKFRIHHLSLFFTKDIQKEWKLFTEIEYEDAPFIESSSAADTVATSQGKLFVEQMYIEYHPAFDWDVRVGRFLTPAGIWSIYHYPPYVPTQRRPLQVRRIFPQVADGVQLRNSFSLGGSFDTHLYVANGAGNPGRLDRNEHKAIGARVNYAANVLGGFELGGSYYGERDNDGIKRNSYGAHLLVTRSAFKLQSEYAYRRNDQQTLTDFNDKGFYAQLTYDIGRWTVAARYDWYDPNDTDPKNDQFRYTGAVNYHFAHNVVGKVEYNRNEFDDPASDDFNEVIFAIVVAIGDL